jgi:hypothetical protein
MGGEIERNKGIEEKFIIRKRKKRKQDGEKDLV